PLLQNDGIVLGARLIDGCHQVGAVLLDVAVVERTILIDACGYVLIAIAILLNTGPVREPALIDDGVGIVTRLGNPGHVAPTAVLVDGCVLVVSIIGVMVIAVAPSAALVDGCVSCIGRLVNSRVGVIDVVLVDDRIVEVATCRDGCVGDVVACLLDEAVIEVAKRCDGGAGVLVRPLFDARMVVNAVLVDGGDVGRHGGGRSVSQCDTQGNN